MHPNGSTGRFAGAPTCSGSSPTATPRSAWSAPSWPNRTTKGTKAAANATFGLATTDLPWKPCRSPRNVASDLCLPHPGLADFGFTVVPNSRGATDAGGLRGQFHPRYTAPAAHDPAHLLNLPAHGGVPRRPQPWTAGTGADGLQEYPLLPVAAVLPAARVASSTPVMGVRRSTSTDADSGSRESPSSLLPANPGRTGRRRTPRDWAVARTRTGAPEIPPRRSRHEGAAGPTTFRIKRDRLSQA
jgi:hypothetical protein